MDLLWLVVIKGLVILFLLALTYVAYLLLSKIKNKVPSIIKALLMISYGFFCWELSICLLLWLCLATIPKLLLEQAYKNHKIIDKAF
ncbi:hypothetical protein N1495_07550 [Streptococcus didelphis]|uniref:hypothetical protein n=1 Tax=Streptococcus didelphis TaxID=102886 RepID=UPI0027D2A38F|nr:hypothetical protein [Streptococcus didelphis]WMB29230.1 hypothetical protein N1495_07550 [Streptococcus didelphis]